MSAIKLTSDNYESIVGEAKVPVLIDFWATWCGPCRMMSPVVEELSDEAEGRFIVCSVNVDEEPELAERFSISVIPTFIAIGDGKEKGKRVGVCQKADLLGLVG